MSKSGPKPSVCIDAVLGDTTLETALSLVKSLSIPAFEFWCWWEKDMDALLNAKQANKLQIAACCTKFVSLVDPAKRADYLRGLEESIAAAQELGCPTLISQVGDALPNAERLPQHQSLVDGLKDAAKLLEGTGITLVIEPLNVLVDHPGYYLVESQEAFQIVEEVSSPSIKVVFDIYHQQVSEGHVIHNLTKNIDKIGHFHAAGNPGRHELDRGELSYPSIIEAIRKTNYEGYVGLEYWPLEAPESGLRRAASWF